MRGPSQPGGGTQVRNGTDRQTAGRSGSGECKDIGALNSIEGKKAGRSTSYLAPNKGSNLRHAFVLTPFYEIYDTCHMKCFMKKHGVTFV